MFLAEFCHIIWDILPHNQILGSWSSSQVDLSFGFIYLEPFENFIFWFEKIGVTKFEAVINECHKISSTTSSENSVRVTHITINKLKGFRISSDRMKRCSDMFALNIYLISRTWVKWRFRNEIQINHSLDEIEVTCPNLQYQISEDSIFKATGIEILLSEELITLSRKRLSQIKPFPKKYLTWRLQTY